MKKTATPEGYVIEDFEPLPFPTDFNVYDVNADGQVSLEELIHVTGEAENVDLAFQATDRNSNNPAGT